MLCLLMTRDGLEESWHSESDFVEHPSRASHRDLQVFICIAGVQLIVLVLIEVKTSDGYEA